MLCLKRIGVGNSGYCLFLVERHHKCIRVYKPVLVLSLAQQNAEVQKILPVKHAIMEKKTLLYMHSLPDMPRSHSITMVTRISLRSAFGGYAEPEETTGLALLLFKKVQPRLSTGGA